MNHRPSSPSRRRFLRSVAIGTTALSLTPHDTLAAFWSRRKGRLVDPARKLNIACVGCGGKGVSDIESVSSENIVGLCDVDDVQAAKTFARFPDVPKFKDYRVMLRELDDRIDAVVVSTPDHMHYAIGQLAITMGKHVFIQKPLTRSIWETRELMRLARKHEVVTQMGNQGHAGEGVRLAREWVQGGVIGAVREVHIWTRKLETGAYRSGRAHRPPGEAVPPTLDWDLWVGTAEHRPYSSEYAPKKWRGWQAYGCGALGDIGCHTMDAPFYALNLGAPDTVQAESAPFSEEAFPDWSIITYEFPARGALPPVTVRWYDGGKLPPRPAELEATRKFEERNGYYFVGDKGVIYDPTEKCSSPRLIPESRMRETKFPPKSIPRVPNGDPALEWINACKGGPRPGSNFDYAGRLTEMVLLGNLAIMARGKKIRWDAGRLRVPGEPGLDRFIRPVYRQDFRLT
jgi:predicted dehydrogenase